MSTTTRTRTTRTAPTTSTRKATATPASKAPASAPAEVTVPAPTLPEVVSLLVATGNAEAARADASNTADESFTASAVATARLLASGVSAVKVARAVKAEVSAGRADARYAYGSDPAVGFHGATGRFLLLTGDMPTVRLVSGATVPVTPREIQLMIKALGQTATDAILKGAKDKSAAFRGMESACVAKGKPSATPTHRAAGTGRAPRVTGKAPATSKAPTSFASLARNAMTILQGAAKVGIATADDRAALADLIKLVNAMEAAAAPKPRARKAA